MATAKLLAIVAQGAAKLTTNREINLGMVHRVLKSRKPVSGDIYGKFQAVSKPRFFESGGYYIMDVDAVSKERLDDCFRVFAILCSKQGIVVTPDMEESAIAQVLDARTVTGPIAKMFNALLNESSGTTILGQSQFELADSIEAKDMLQGSISLVRNETSGYADVRIDNVRTVKAETISKANGTLVGLFGNEFALEFDLDAALAGIEAGPAAKQSAKQTATQDDVLANL